MTFVRAVVRGIALSVLIVSGIALNTVIFANLKARGSIAPPAVASTIER